jgi:hypothetical protein
VLSGASTPSVSLFWLVLVVRRLMGTRSTDQMGVELGKVLAKNILAQLGKPEDVTGHDSSAFSSRVFVLTDRNDFRLPVSSITTRSIARSRISKRVT